MIFPEFIREKDGIGVTAPSDGNRKEIDFLRVEFAKKNLEDKGFFLKITKNVTTSSNGRSSLAGERAEQLMELFMDNRIKSVISAKGGDFLMEVLPLLDYAKIAQNPKWIQGYSDNTGLLFTITTLCDVATMYSNHFNDFAMEPWHISLQNNLDLLKGKEVIQESFDYYEDGFYDKVTGKEGYQKDKPVCLTGTKDNLSIRGRLIGGCLDVLLNLVGTKYDKVKDFANKYKEDGILWYLESFSLDSECLLRGLWQLREAGWFEHASGFVFGRPCMYESPYGFSYKEVVMSVLEPLGLPIIFDADTGHKGPQFTVINGALGTWNLNNNKGFLSMELK